MKLKFLILLTISVFISQFSSAQEIFVDTRNGNDINTGTADNPFKTIEKAIVFSDELKDSDQITIKLLPGLYVLNEKIVIDTENPGKLIIEAGIMPNDSGWIPEKMPIIASFSANNSTEQFPHSAGFQVLKNNVLIRGLKFLGNPNPEVPFYYPISRPDTLLDNLEVSRCYFVAEQNSSNIQGGVWAHGNRININHCVFYNCRNAILLFKNINSCSITNNIMYGAYESALWIGGNDSAFVFKNNVVTGGNYFWIKGKKSSINYEINDCVIADNLHYYGAWSNEKNEIVECDKHNLSEKNIVKSGKIQLVERKTYWFPHNNLNLTSNSTGLDLNAGIFIEE